MSWHEATSGFDLELMCFDLCGLLRLFSASLTFICSVGLWTSPGTGRSNLSVSSFHVCESNKVKDMEKRRSGRKNKHRGLNLTSGSVNNVPAWRNSAGCRQDGNCCPQMSWSEMSQLCDHTAAKATPGSRTSTAEGTRPGNERASEKKPLEAILALTLVGVPAKKQDPLNSSFFSPRSSTPPCTLFTTQSHSLPIAFAIAFLQRFVWWLSQMWLNKYSAAWLLNPSITRGKFTRDPRLKGTSGWADRFPLGRKTVQLLRGEQHNKIGITSVRHTS